MAREFGKRSYHPETISFASSGNQPSGLPQSAIRRKIPVNILCHAYNNPCTLQELALEPGIALPYIEEETKLLLNTELLKKTDHEKYLTNFFILPRECQNEINEKCCIYAQQHVEAFWQLAEKTLEKAIKLGVSIGDYSKNDGQMFFAFYLEQNIEIASFSENIYSKFKRADGGNWGIIGYEHGSTCRLPSAFFNNMGNGWNGINWDGYQVISGNKVFRKVRYQKDVPNEHLNMTLKKVADNSDPEAFSEIEKENLQKLIKEGFCIVRDDDSVIVNAIFLGII